MEVDVYPARVNFEAQVYKGVPALGKKSRVCLLDGFSDVGRLHTPVVDEQKDGRLFGTVVGIGGEPLGLERPAVIGRGELGEFARNAASVYLTDSVVARSARLDGDAR